jgi:hypothetical protein
VYPTEIAFPEPEEESVRHGICDSIEQHTTGQQGVVELERNREEALLARAEEPAMTRSNYHLMIDRGRKAGLSTRELYPALLTQPIEGNEQPGQMDCNGVVSTVTPEGHRGYRPSRSSGGPRPA